MSCPECFTGTVRHDEKPTGTETQLHGRKTYVAEPANGAAPKGIIVIVPDAFGYEFINNKILADHYASKGGFKVYLPDFMDGTAAPTSMMASMGKLMDGKASLWEWLWKPYYLFSTISSFGPFLYHNRPGLSWPKVHAWMTALRASDEGQRLPIGAAGFCWGGRHVFNLAHGADETLATTPTTTSSKHLVDAVYTAHPSFLVFPADAEKVILPTSVGIGDKDFVIGAADVQTMKTIFDRKEGEGVDCEVVVYPGAGHGFAVRADFGNEKVAAQAIEAEEQAVAWFARCFDKVRR